jgi:nucleoside-diphosphate-sugar epimerase
MDRTCLIVGCGYTGLRLARRLRPAWRVVAVARSADTASRLEAEGLATLRADLDAPIDSGPPAEALAAAADGAAIAYLAPPPDGGEGDPRLARFLAALGPARPAAFVYMSTTGVYGDTGGATVTEASPVAPSNDRSRRRVAAERAATTWCEARGVRAVVLRVPGIYGPQRLPLERLARGEPALRPEDAGPGNRIHVDDLVTACVAALERPVQGVFNVTDGNPASTTVYLQRTAALAGLPPPPLVALAEAPGRIGAGMLAFLVESRQVDNRRMREELGVEPRYAKLDDGIAASLAGMLAPTD